MPTSNNYYTTKLYPLMDGFLQVVQKLDLPFYLTGGTALSRHYLQHRYSDDLDLFVNQDADFIKYIKKLDKAVNTTNQSFHIDNTRILKTRDYLSMYINSIQDTSITLKIDFVNDSAPHFGGFESDPLLGRVDSWRNILSNKLTALYRYEPKDVIDIVMLASQFEIDWEEIFREAQTKEPSVNPIEVVTIMRTMPVEKIREINFINEIDINILFEKVQKVANDILYGKSR